MTKPFKIPKALVWEAFQRVKANGGSAGVDGESIEEFEKSLGDNLYRLWNRMGSGSYFPPPVKAVPIPKKSGGTRRLGVPTVADRVAQTVVKLVLEPVLEPVFDRDSFGYRPGRSALDAVELVRRRSWKYDWVVEFDIKGLFDNIDHELLLRAVRKHCNTPWVLLYIERWLKAPMETEQGILVARERGTPQGGVVTPLTQKVISSLKEPSRDGEKGAHCLTSVVNSNTFMAHGAFAFDQSGKSSGAERRSWFAPASSCTARSSVAAVTRVRFVRAPSISLPGRSLPARSTCRGSRGHSADHVETSAAYGGTPPEVREKQRTDHWSNRDRRVECVSTHSKKAWLSRLEKAAHFKSKFPIRLIACSSRSSRRLTTFWFHVASAPSACA